MSESIDSQIGAPANAQHHEGAPQEASTEFSPNFPSEQIQVGADSQAHTASLPVFNKFSPESLNAPAHLFVSGSLRFSRTFELYRRIFSKLELPDLYVPHEIALTNGGPDVESLRELIQVFRSTAMMRSMVIADPFRRYVVRYLDELEPQAQEVGAVNMVWKREDKLVGGNLDGDAFSLGVKEESNISFSKSSMVFFGCGSLASAVALKLAPKLATVALIDIHLARAEVLGRKLSRRNPKLRIFFADRSEELDLKSYEIFYNGTGLGMISSNSNAHLLTPLHAFDELPTSGIAIDPIYTPWESAFLRRFSAMDFDTVNGFSQMVAFTSLHLSRVTGREISYRLVRELSDFVMPSDSRVESANDPWQDSGLEISRDPFSMME